jgi:hypothetical protein
MADKRYEQQQLTVTHVERMKNVFNPRGCNLIFTGGERCYCIIAHFNVVVRLLLTD